MAGYTATRYAGDTGVATTVGATGDQSTDASLAPGAARFLSTTVDFGVSGSTNARTTVASVPWAVSFPRPMAFVVGRPQREGLGDVAQGNDEDALGISAIVTNVVDGTSFDILAFSPDGSGGVFTVQVIGVDT